MSTLIEQAQARQWFYSFELPDGSTTSSQHDSEIMAIHDTRWQMLQSCMDERLGQDRSGLTVLDLASHQGWFAVNMARAGFSSVLGIDARESHVEDSQLIRDIYGLGSVLHKKFALLQMAYTSFMIALILGVTSFIGVFIWILQNSP